jgi:hypothetical protein
MPPGEEKTVAHAKVRDVFITHDQAVVQNAACTTLGNRVDYFAVCLSLVDQCEELRSSTLHRFIEYEDSRNFARVIFPDWLFRSVSDSVMAVLIDLLLSESFMIHEN